MWKIMWKLLLQYCIWHEQTLPISTGVCKRHICKFLQQRWESSSVKAQSWWLREIGSSGTWQSSRTKKMGEQLSQRIICWRNMAVVVAQWNWELKNLTIKSGKSLQRRWPGVQPNDSLSKKWQQFWLSEIGSSRTWQFNQASFCNVYWRWESSSAKGLYMEIWQWWLKNLTIKSGKFLHLESSSVVAQWNWECKNLTIRD